MNRYKPYPEYKPSGVEWLGDVPAHWEVKRLRFVAMRSNSNVDKKSYEGQKPVRLCNYTDVYYNERITNGLDFMQATATDEEIRRFSLVSGDVIITKDSEDPHDIGVPAIVSEPLDNVVCGYHLTILRSKKDISPAFLFRVLQSHPTKAHFYVESPGITRFGLSQDTVGDLSIPLAPLSEQSAVADFLDRETGRIGALVEKKRRFIELLKEKRQALITAAVTGRFNVRTGKPYLAYKPSGVEWLGDVPAHWEAKKLKYIATFVGGGTPAKENLAYWNGSIPWVSPKDMKSEIITDSIDHITPEGLANSSTTLVESGSVLLVARSGILRHMIPVGINQVPVSLNQDMKALALDERKIRPLLFLRWVQGLNRSLLIAWTKQGATVESLEYEYVANSPIPLPDLEEQDAIVAFLDRETGRIDALIEKTEQSIELLREKRAALITAAVTGKIDVRDAAREDA